MGEVFADRMQCTIDKMGYRDVRSLLLPILQSLGAFPEQDDPSIEKGLWRHVDGGTLKVARYGKVAAIGASGKFLSALRAAKMLGEFLHIIATEPHKVTVLDATLDIPVDAPPVVNAFYDLATSLKGVQLTRKRIAVTEVTKVFGMRLDGRESGTVYAGSRHSETQLKVYDKQAERFFHGVMDAAPGVRYELTLKGGQVSMHDVYDPTGVFWHHMHRILPRPAGVTPWDRSDMGLTLPRTPEMEPLDRLRKRISFSPDIAELVRSAREISGDRKAALSLISELLADAYP
jgi:hypothetical protein